MGDGASLNPLRIFLFMIDFKLQAENIFAEIKKAWETDLSKPVSSYYHYIYFYPDNNMFLYYDTQIHYETFNILFSDNKIKFDGFFKHQGILMCRYSPTKNSL